MRLGCHLQQLETRPGCVTAALAAAARDEVLRGTCCEQHALRTTPAVRPPQVVYNNSLSGHYEMSWVASHVSVTAMYLLVLFYEVRAIAART
jgi:hypothetical protein